MRYCGANIGWVGSSKSDCACLHVAQNRPATQPPPVPHETGGVTVAETIVALLADEPETETFIEIRRFSTWPRLRSLAEPTQSKCTEVALDISISFRYNKLWADNQKSDST